MVEVVTSLGESESQVGLAVWPGTPPGEVIRIARQADEAGLHSFWVTESTLAPGRDAVSILGAVAASTKRLRLATGIINVFTRTATLIASTIATLDELSNGRMILGLGTGHARPIADWHSVPFQHPLTRMREYVEVIRRVLAYETVEFHGKTVEVEGFKLAVKPLRESVPIYLAAVGRQTAKLAGRMGEGMLVTMNALEQLRSLLEIGTRASKSLDRGFDTAAYILSFLSEDPEVAYATARRVFATYCSAVFYNKVFVAAGYEKEARAIAQRWQAGDRDGAAEMVTDRMIHDFAAVGVPETLKMVEEYRKVGVRLPIISPVYAPGYEKSLSGLISGLSP